MGIVNLTRVWQTGQHEQANTQLPTSSLPVWSKHSSSLAVSEKREERTLTN